MQEAGCAGTVNLFYSLRVRHLGGVALECQDMSHRVLVVEDDPELAELLERKLGGHGFEVDCVSTGTEALDLFDSYRPDLVLLDVRLPDISGLEVCRELRTRSHTPIIILSVMAREEDKVAGLRHGADDYITKPFSLRELVVRIEGLLLGRQPPAPAPDAPPEPSRGVLEAGDLSIDVRGHEVLLPGRKLRLPPTQFKILRILVERAQRVVSPASLVERVWPDGLGKYSDLAEAIMALRFVIEEDPVHPRRIVHVPPYGYQFIPHAAQGSTEASTYPDGEHPEGLAGRGDGSTDVGAPSEERR